MNILFVGDFRWNSGSSHTVYNYYRIAPEFNCAVKISKEFGSLDEKIIKYIPICEDIIWADHVVFVFEANQYLNEAQINYVLKAFSRPQITIIDPDARYGPTVNHLNDSNHIHYSSESWAKLFETLSTRILQPRLSTLPPNVQFFSYFGMEHQPLRSREVKHYSIQYIGNNWYRWEAIKGFLLQIMPIRQDIGQIAIKGKWWDGSYKPGLKQATLADVDLLNQFSVETGTSVPFGTVISRMGDSWISPIFVRPMISAMSLITPRMFETICASTVPIWPNNVQYICQLYGKGSRELCYNDNLTTIVQDILIRPTYYLDLTQHIGQRLFEVYNYRLVFQQLLAILSS